MNVFIDTNVFLSFYRFTNDDLSELEKLAELIKEDRVKLWVPEQVRDELLRNRERIVSEAIGRLKKNRLQIEYPAMCKSFEEYTRLREYEKSFEKDQDSLVQKLEAAIKSKSLKADEVIEGLLKVVRSIPLKPETLESARLRHKLGNPPGKRDSLGDAINWETLLAKIPRFENLYFVSADNDYYSPIDPDIFNEFLLEEWNTKKDSELVPYRSLSEFFKNHFPHIRVTADLKKQLLIENLINSSNFQQTHSALRRLNRYTEFAPEQASSIAEAAVYNSQISFIIEDADVKYFLKPIVENYAENIGEFELKWLRQALKIYPEQDEVAYKEPEGEYYEELYLPEAEED